MKFWGYSTGPRSCGKCNRTIRTGEVALRLTMQSAPHLQVWRCADCAGPPPADVVLADEAKPSDVLEEKFMARLKDVIRRTLPDWKTRQSGDANE